MPSGTGSSASTPSRSDSPPTSGSCRAPRSSSSCAIGCSTSSSTRYRPLGDPDPLPGSAGDPLQPAQGRGRRSGDLPRLRRSRGRPGRAPCRARRRADADEDARAAAEAAVEAAARRLELARAFARYQALMAEAGFIDFGDQVSLALRLVREFAGGSSGDPAAVPLHPGRRVPGHEPRPGGARRADRRTGPEPDRGRRRRPVDLPVPRRGDEQPRRVPGALPPGRRSSSCAATTGPEPASSPPAIGSSGSTTRTVSRSRPGSTSGSAPNARNLRPGRRPPSVRHQAFATGSDEADWVAAEIVDADRCRRRAGATTPSSSARTPRRTGSCAASMSPGCRGASPGPRGCTPGRRSAC